MQNIDIYNNSELILQRKESKIYKIFILIILIFLLIVFLLITLYKYDKTFEVKGIIIDNKINLTLSEKNLKLLSNNKILVNSEEYAVDIFSISEVIYDSNYNAYYETSLNIALEQGLLIDNNILDISILLGKATLYESLKERIKEGIR